MGRPRTSRTVPLRAAAWSAGLVVLSSPLLASAAIAPVVITYQADPACPDEAAFLDAVRAQTPNLTEAPPGAPARRIAIEIAPEGNQLVGRLRVDELDGTTFSRDVASPRCDEIVSALALFTALTIDSGPTASPAPARPPAPVRARPPRSAPLPDLPVLVTPRDQVPWPRVELGAMASVRGGLAPTLAGGVEPFFDWSTWRTTSGFAPSLRFALAFAASPTTATPGGTVTFVWLAARASACPLALVLGPLTVRPCSGIDAGILHGQGGDLAHPAAATRPWIAPTIAARAQWTIAAAIHVELEAGLTVPLIRDRFVFDTPPVDAHAAPPIAGFASLGVGFLLPSPPSPRFP
jgi:hypothetical protein